jgi:photosystem II stability/assembly factor-like uncharacterized protein
LRLEILEDRTLLSTSIPLNRFSWTPIGPAPITNTFPTFVQTASGRITGIGTDPTDPNTIYVAAAGGGVWKTTDAGASWTPLTDNQATLVMGAIAIAPSDPNTIYAGTGEANYGPSKIALRAERIFSGDGVLKSTDGGATWTLLGSDVFFRRTISRIVIDPNDPNTVYVAVGALAFDGLTGNTGIWKSTDGGNTWSDMINGIPNFSDTDAVSDLAIDPTDGQHLYAAVGTPSSSRANGVYQTFDGGATWSAAGNFPQGASDSSLGRITLALAPSSPETLYAAVATSGSNAVLYHMYKTTNGGTTWSALSSVPNYMGPYGDYNTSLAVDPTNANIVFAGGQTSFLESLSGGTSWSDLENFGNDPPHADHHAIAFDANGKMLVGSDGGIWRAENTTGGGNPNWSDLNHNLNTVQLVGIALDPTTADVAWGGAQDNGAEQFLDNQAWEEWGFGGDGGFVRIDFSNPNTVYVTNQYTDGPIFLDRADDGGRNFQAVTNGINTNDPGNFQVPYVLDPSNSNRLLLGTNRVYETTNRGDLWHAISQPGANGWTVSDVVDAVAAAASDANTVYATAGGRVFVTHNDGASWMETDPTTPSSALRYRDIRVDPRDANTAYVVAANFSDVTGGGQVWMTRDGGADWTNISGSLPDEPFWTVAVLPRTNKTTLFVGGDDGVYVSNNLGKSWAREAAGLPHVQVRQLEVQPGLGILAAGTYGRGLWELKLPHHLFKTGPSEGDGIDVDSTSLTGVVLPVQAMGANPTVDQLVMPASPESEAAADVFQLSPPSAASSPANPDTETVVSQGIQTAAAAADAWGVDVLSDGLAQWA